MSETKVLGGLRRQGDLLDPIPSEQEEDLEKQDVEQGWEKADLQLAN